MNSRQKKIAFLSSLFIMGIFFSLLFAEIILRITDFHYQLYLGKVEFGWPVPNKISTLYIFDSELFWVQKDYYDKLKLAHKNKPKIIFMGDSSVELGTYPEYLMELISIRFPDRKILYEKFVACGYSSYQGLQQLKRDIIELRPKIITIHFGWNDHWCSFGVEDKGVKYLAKSPISQFQRFRLIQLILKFQAAILEKKNKIGRLPKRVPPEDFRSNLLEMIRIARNNSIIPILLTAPSFHEKGHEPEYLKNRFLQDLADLIPLHQEYIFILRDVAAREKVILCDLARELEVMPKEDLRNKYFTQDGIHLTLEGNKQIAQYLYECFDKNNLWEELIK